MTAEQRFILEKRDFNEAKKYIVDVLDKRMNDYFIEIKENLNRRM